MADDFKYDVFLSHSSKDKDIVRAVAERLRADGLRVWFDSWELRPGDSIPVKIEEGLEASRVLVLCMSANAFGSDWAKLESYTFRFRDPLNQERRFIPLRLDTALIKGSLAQFLYINWMPEVREQEYAKLFEACRPIESSVTKPDGLSETQSSLWEKQWAEQADNPGGMILPDETWRQYTRDVFYDAIWTWHYKPEKTKTPFGLIPSCLECPQDYKLQPTHNFMGIAHYLCEVCGTEYRFPLGASGNTQLIKNEIVRKLEDGSFREVVSQQRASRGF